MTTSRLYLAFALTILVCCNYKYHRDKRVVRKAVEKQHKRYEKDRHTIALAELNARNLSDTIITVRNGYFHNDWMCKKNGTYTLFESKPTYKLKPKEGYFRRPVKVSMYSLTNFDTIIDLLRHYRIDTITSNPEVDTTKYCGHCVGSTYIIVVNNDTLVNYYIDYRITDTLHLKFILAKTIDEKLYFHHSRNKDIR